MPLRDYDISITLGITESKVRNLRVKSQLMYPRKRELTEELAKSIEYGYYEHTTDQLTVTFEEPSFQNLQNAHFRKLHIDNNLDMDVRVLKIMYCNIPA